MKYEDTNLPKKVSKYLDLIYEDKELNDAFFECDIELYGPEWITDLENDENWLEDLMGPGETNYDLKPFAREGTGALWTLLNDEIVGYIGTEGECGIVARNIDEFMNIVATLKCSFIRLKDEDDFIKNFNKINEEYEHKQIMNKFIEQHKFEKDPKKIYELLKLGITTKPFFVIKAIDDEYVDSYSIIGHDDGQESLERFIRDYL